MIDTEVTTAIKGLYLFVRNILFVIFTLLFISCSSKDVSPSPSVDLDREMEHYYPLIEESLMYRELSSGFYDRLKKELDTNGHLSAASVHMLKHQTEVQTTLRQNLYQRAYKYEPWLEDETLEKDLRLKGIMFSLSAALVLYDNYLLNLSMFQHDPHLRQIINTPDSEYHLIGNALLRSTGEFKSYNNYLRMKKAISIYQKEITADHDFDEQMVYLQTLIENSPSYHAIKERDFFDITTAKLSLYDRSSKDTLKLLSHNGINLLSEIFGNSIGLIATRKGLMYDNKKIMIDTEAQLQAGDILLEKTPFRLTDKLIPGYWGHAAIWSGDRQELMELGIWEHPFIVPHQKEIIEGKRVIEALREGVVINTLSHFLNIDDMAVLREDFKDKATQRDVLLHAFAQIGKAYDFNFDVETTDKIVCSELVYTAYPHIAWPTDHMLGRYTISPDHIAKKTEEGILELILLYHDGQKVNTPKQRWKLLSADHHI